MPSWQDPFDPVEDEDRTAFASLSLLAGIAGVALGPYFAITGSGIGSVIAGGICVSVGLFSLTIARRLRTNRSAVKGGLLVSPWLTLGVGTLLIVVGIGNIVEGERGGVWMIPPGLAAAIFAVRQLRSDDQPRNGV